jgi:hypothetical protein
MKQQSSDVVREAFFDYTHSIVLAPDHEPLDDGKASEEDEEVVYTCYIETYALKQLALSRLILKGNLVVNANAQG